MQPRRLTLVRHAQAVWDESVNDFERELDARGRRDAPMMAKRLASELGTEGRPPRLVSSPARRALSTAQIFADALGVGHKDIALDARIYEATPGTLLEVVRGLPDAATRVTMFGHNPGFTDFVRWLADCAFSEMPTCSAVELALEGSWRDANPGAARLLNTWWCYPKRG